ncbi:MAG: EAL domain-containing protein [Thermoanaerobaculia bacterium]
MSTTETAAATTRILIVEDSEPDARVLRSLLQATREASFETVHATTLAEGLERIASEPFDLVLLDLGLPDAQELEGLDAIREAAPELAVVVVTGRHADELAAAALQGGAEDYLTKGGFDRALLVRTARYAVERRRGRSRVEAMSRELAAANARLESLLMIDPLTELLNRRGLDAALAQMVERIDREKISVLAFFVDLDEFKKVNDRWGHAVGDSVLIEAAARLGEAARGVDAVGRLGGDEFLVLMPGPGESEMPAIAERLRLAVASTALDTGGTTIRLTACIAVVPLSSSLGSLDLLVSRMHFLLRLSKKGGRNCVAWEGMAYAEPPRGLDAICDDLRQGRGTFAVLQPIFRLDEMSVAGFELLTRFRQNEAHTPDAVFRFCAERNMLTLADHHCLRTCIALAEALPKALTRHVNIFPSTLLSTPPESILDLFPTNRDLFCVELSEQQMLGDSARLQQSVQTLRRGGLKIACDDVGFGRSHLESLVLLEPDVIKLDKRCIFGIAEQERRRHHLARFISVARKLGAEVIAEGIERKDDLEVLRDLGVDYGQGFLWGMPAIYQPQVAS